jgi:membrane protease YdiL (CAAX protease family)
MSQQGDQPERQVAASAWLVPALVFALAFPTFATWLYFIQFAGSSAVRVFYGAGKLAQFCFPLLYVGLMERGRPRAADDRNRRSMSVGRSLWIGGGVGLAVAAVMLGVYFALLKQSDLLAGVPSEVRAKLADAGADSPGGFLTLAVFYALIHSLLEEYYWRWFVFGRLRDILPLRSAIVISSLGFMAHHTLVVGKYFGGASPMTILLSAAVAIGGAIWAWLYESSRALYGPWLSHLLVDAGLMLIGYQMVFGS